MTCYNSLFMHSVWVWSCFGRCSVKHYPHSTANNLQAAFPGRFSGSALLKSLSHDIPRDKQAAKTPTGRASAPAGRGIVNVHSTMLLLSVLSSFFHLPSLKANNGLISKVVSTSLENDEGNFRQILGMRRKSCFMLWHRWNSSLSADQTTSNCDPQGGVLKICFRVLIAIFGSDGLAWSLHCGSRYLYRLLPYGLVSVLKGQ